MPELNLTTPALLFPAISLLLLAYTNRFLAVASLTRHLHALWQENKDVNLSSQIQSLTSRVVMIRNMQALGVSSFLLCVITMIFIYTNQQTIAVLVFGVSMILLALSLIISLQEILASTRALKLQLEDMSQ
jgi:hypothetical protein